MALDTILRQITKEGNHGVSLNINADAGYTSTSQTYHLCKNNGSLQNPIAVMYRPGFAYEPSIIAYDRDGKMRFGWEVESLKKQSVIQEHQIRRNTKSLLSISHNRLAESAIEQDDIASGPGGGDVHLLLEDQLRVLVERALDALGKDQSGNTQALLRTLPVHILYAVPRNLRCEQCLWLQRAGVKNEWQVSLVWEADATSAWARHFGDQSRQLTAILFGNSSVCIFRFIMISSNRA